MSGKRKRRTLRAQAVEVLQARYDRAIERMLACARRADRLARIIERRMRPARRVAETLGGDDP